MKLTQECTNQVLRIVVVKLKTNHILRIEVVRMKTNQVSRIVVVILKTKKNFFTIFGVQLSIQAKEA
jgi:hypothetical protein